MADEYCIFGTIDFNIMNQLFSKVIDKEFNYSYVRIDLKLDLLFKENKMF